MAGNGRPDVRDRAEQLRRLPAVDRLLQAPGAADLLDRFGHTLTVAAFRTVLERQRAAIQSGATVSLPDNVHFVTAAAEWLDSLLASPLQPVINATGVIVHTNLGRAPLSETALQAVSATAGGYSTLEYDLESGGRGVRAARLEALLCRLTSTEASLVVNNNAAAVLLMLSALCHGREVIISRGQLVEIGGGFRVPDVMAQSGARLVEVGATNRTHLRDYAGAINEQTAAILVAHHSNFKIVGFTGEPSLAEVAQLAHANDLSLLYDQGSGALHDTSPYGLEREPTVPDGIAAGCDVIAFSGDKLLGGPQAGLLVGGARYLDIIRRHPLARAVRADKMALAALAATLSEHLAGRATETLPVWQMISRPAEELAATAAAWVAHLQERGIKASTLAGESTVGGGSLPGTTLPTTVVALETPAPDALAARLRHASTPVVTLIRDGRLVLDPRTVLPSQADALLAAVQEAAATSTSENDHE